MELLSFFRKLDQESYNIGIENSRYYLYDFQQIVLKCKE